MFQKIMDGTKFSFKPKTDLGENEVLCDECGGTGWLVDYEDGAIHTCPKCHGRRVLYVCPHCGQANAGRYCPNPECSAAKHAEREAAMFEKAIKADIKDLPAEFKGMVYADNEYGYQDGYFADIDELREYCEDQEFPMPKYVWGTTSTTLELSAKDIVACACDELFEDAFDRIDKKEIARLQLLLDEWLAPLKESTRTYAADYTYAILTE